MVLDMNKSTFAIVITLLSWFLAPAQTSHYSIQAPDGFCYNEYSYRGQSYPICYLNTSMDKTQFHFHSQDRNFIILHSERNSSGEYGHRILLYDTRNNAIKEIDSCLRDNTNNLLRYLGTDGDTLYVCANNGKKTSAISCLQPRTPHTISTKKSAILREVTSLPNIGTWCVSPGLDKIAYADKLSGLISIVLPSGENQSSIGTGEVLAWTDSNHLLYSNILVEGYGDLFYDLLEYNGDEKTSRTIARHLDNVFDYYNGILVYGKSPNKICMAGIENGILSDLIELDLSNHFFWIHTAYLLNTNELVIGGDRHGFESFYYKCVIQDWDNINSHYPLLQGD